MGNLKQYMQTNLPKYTQKKLMNGPLLTNTQKSIFKWYLSLQTLINVDVKLHKSKSSQPQQLGVMTG